MDIVNFPLCCSARVICGFGGGHINETEHWTKRELIKWLCEKLTHLKKHSVATVVAMPTTSQPNAIAALEEVGFYMHPLGEAGGGDTMFKDHRDSCMFLPLKEWEEKAFLETYNPKKDKYKDGQNHGYTYEKNGKTNANYW